MPSFTLHVHGPRSVKSASLGSHLLILQYVPPAYGNDLFSGFAGVGGRNKNVTVVKTKLFCTQLEFNIMKID